MAHVGKCSVKINSRGFIRGIDGENESHRFKLVERRRISLVEIIYPLSLTRDARNLSQALAIVHMHDPFHDVECSLCR